MKTKLTSTLLLALSTCAFGSMEFQLKHEGISLVIKDLRSCTIEEGFAVSAKPGSTLREYIRKIYIKLNAKDAERVKEFGSRLLGKNVDVSIAGIHVW